MRQVLGQGAERMGISLKNLWPGAQRGSGKIQRRAGNRTGWNGPAIRQNHPRTAAETAFKIARVAQVRESTADGGAASPGAASGRSSPYRALLASAKSMLPQLWAALDQKSVVLRSASQSESGDNSTMLFGL
jgi:hypothetical protein